MSWMVCQTFDIISKLLMVTEKVFNILTDNGNIQGLFMDNGQLHIDGEYINKVFSTLYLVFNSKFDSF